MSTKGAPMPKKEDDIVNNSMKLYAYLVCIAGLAAYPENTRMFRQKDLMFTKIKKATGITNDTVKLYLYYLEENRLIKYRGEYQFNFVTADNMNHVEYRAARLAEAKRVFELRYKNEKQGVYHIPRPNPYIPIPEQTLEKLNNFFQCSELEIKLYLYCAAYQDLCSYQGIACKPITFEDIREDFQLKGTGSDINKQIRMSLLFLCAIGLIDYTEGIIINRKNAKISCFKLKSVKYYVEYDVKDFSCEKTITEDEKKAILERISKN